MPTFVPPNVKFEVDDVESAWLHQTKFDFIFCRYMAASIFDWPNLVNTTYEFVLRSSSLIAFRPRLPHYESRFRLGE